MLINLDTGKEITRMPYAAGFRTVMKRLTPAQIVAMKDALNTMIDGDEIHTAGWMPGSDWTGTPFMPLYTVGARGDYTVAAKMFGLLVWQVFMEHPERWGSGRYQKDGRDIGSRTYFRLR